MKKLYSILALAAPLALSAQLQELRNSATQNLHGQNKGVSFFSENFDSDLNGWTVETTVGVVDWKWTNIGPGTTTSTYPVPPLATSTPSGWAIIDDDFDGTGGQSSDASLISPAIDLSSAPANLRVRFEQYFQEFQADATFVGVSVDGGSTWNEVEINDGVGREGRPNPEVIEVNISEWVAANPTNVQLRFRYTSTWDYGWQVDNIAIVEQFQYDMIAVSSFLSHNGVGDEFGRIPASQLYPTMLLGGEVKNDGYLEQTNVQATMTITNSGGTQVLTETVPLGNLAPNTSAFMEEFVTLPDLGNDVYTATFSVTSDQNASDPNTANNARVRAFEVTDAHYSLDGIGIHPSSIQILGSLGTNSFDGGEDGLIAMTYYEVREPLEVYGIEFLTTANSNVGGFVTVAVLDTSDVLANPAVLTSPVVESDAWDITPTNIAQGIVGVLFPNVTTLQPGGYYAAVTLNSNAGAGHIRVVDDLSVPQPALSSAIYIPADQVYTNGNALAIRLLTQPVNIGVQEVADLAVRVFPNPSNGIVRLELATTGSYQAEVISVAGELAHSERITGTSTMDLSTLAKGLYTIRVIGENATHVSTITLQ
jgi:hypothetical protein